MTCFEFLLNCIIFLLLLLIWVSIEVFLEEFEKMGSKNSIHASPIPLSDPVPHRSETRNTECVVCLYRERDMVFKPCRHLVCCYVCSKRLRKCPVCTKRIRRQERIFNS